MKFKQYLGMLNALAKEYPESLKLDVIYGVDDEGSDFRPVIYPPDIGNKSDIGFKAKEKFSPSENLELNAVCVN